MSSHEYQAPDLASILKTLASLAPKSQQQAGEQSKQDAQSHSYLAAPLLPPYQQSWPTQVQTPASITRSTPANNTKVIDPATITDWSSGLKCVMRTAAKHESMLQDIRHMIKIQHENEEQWWKGRQALIERQKGRAEGQKKIVAVLKLVGGAPTTGASNSSPEELAKELETFDMKVYKAQLQMAKEFTAKLRSLGVPFFGTKSDLVRISGNETVGTAGNNHQGEKGLIDESELVKLQKKMLAILEDLCSN